MKIAGVVLAGGASRRMGRTKAVVEVDGRMMADRVLDALRAVRLGPVFVYGGDADDLGVLGADVVAEQYPGEGPVGGVLGTLDHLAGCADAALILPCDIPFVDATTLRRLLVVATTERVVVARTTRLEPMCALWPLGCRNAIADLFADGERAMHRVIDACPHVVVDVEPHGLVNINAPADVARARSLRSLSVPIDEISVNDLHTLGPDAVVIDVREDDEWADGHIAHARHVALGTVPDHLDAFTGSPTYVICKAGGRSLRACEFAATEGHEVVNVAGGMMAWTDAGFETSNG